MERAEGSRGSLELKLDATPEGIVAFSKYIIELIGKNLIDPGRASVINAHLQTILRTTESGLDAIKIIEEDSANLEKAVRAVTRDTSKPSK